MNEHNAKLEQQASKRRAKYLRLHKDGKTQTELALIAGVSRQRMQWMIAKAKTELLIK